MILAQILNMCFYVDQVFVLASLPCYVNWLLLGRVMGGRAGGSNRENDSLEQHSWSNLRVASHAGQSTVSSYVERTSSIRTHFVWMDFTAANLHREESRPAVLWDRLWNTTYPILWTRLYVIPCPRLDHPDLTLSHVSFRVYHYLSSTSIYTTIMQSTSFILP